MHIKSFSIILLFLISACGNDAIESMQNIQNSEFNEVMEEAARDEYEPPANGMLTEDHIKMYIAVREHEQTLIKGEAEKVKEKVANAKESDEESFSGFLKNMDAIQQTMSYGTLDIRAAKELKYNTAEYEWVKETLMDISTQEMIDSMSVSQEDMNKNMEQAITQLENARDNSSDPQMRATIDQQILEAKQSIEEMKQELIKEQEAITPAIKHNLALYTKHKDELKVLETELSKWQKLDELTDNGSSQTTSEIAHK